MATRKRQRKWTLLFRFEEECTVYLYEPLRKCDLNARLRDGWKKIG
ncbi:hypothetical protein [Bacillus sp. 03113]|nr:hypothetical protein [Bacillus sp. 03113]